MILICGTVEALTVFILCQIKVQIQLDLDVQKILSSRVVYQILDEHAKVKKELDTLMRIKLKHPKVLELKAWLENA